MIDVKKVLNISAGDYATNTTRYYELEGVCVTGVVKDLNELEKKSPKQRLAEAAPDGTRIIVEYDVKFVNQSIAVTGYGYDLQKGSIFFEANGIALIPKPSKLLNARAK